MPVRKEAVEVRDEPQSLPMADVLAKLPTSTRKKASPTTEQTTTKDPVLSVKDGVATVSYGVSITKNLGNFESLKISADITIPLDADAEMLKKVDELMITARETVVARLGADLTDITSSLT